MILNLNMIQKAQALRRVRYVLIYLVNTFPLVYAQGWYEIKKKTLMPYFFGGFMNKYAIKIMSDKCVIVYLGAFFLVIHKIMMSIIDNFL